MVLQEKKKEGERKSYLKNSKAQKFKLRENEGDTKGWEAQKKMWNGKKWESGEESKKFLKNQA